MKAVVAAFNQEKALVGAFSVITNLRLELFGAPQVSNTLPFTLQTSDCSALFLSLPRNIKVCEYLYDLRLIHISFITKFWSAMADEQIAGGEHSVAQHCVSTLGTVWCDVILLCGVSWQYVLILLATSHQHIHTKNIFIGQVSEILIGCHPFPHPDCGNSSTKKWKKCFYKCNLK